MIILKNTTETLQATARPYLVAPIRKGKVHTTGSGGGVTLTPDGTISVGDWMILIVATYDTIVATTPSGWTVLQPMTLAGTQNTVIYGKLREEGDTSYSVTLSAGSASSDGTLVWGSGGDVVGNWIVGSTMARGSITPATTTDSVAPAITTLDDHTMILSISTERTVADESDIANITGAEKWVYFAQNGASDIQSTTIAVVRDFSPGGTTSEVRFTHVNPQSSNAQAVQIGIPPAKTVVIDTSITYVETDPGVGSTYSSSETKLVGSGTGNYTIFTNEIPASMNPGFQTDPVELGVSFTPSVSGQIKAIRYYKGTNAAYGQKVGSIWTAGGTLLSSVTFTQDTITGWQTQNLSSPLAVTAGTEYVVSYYNAYGQYSYTASYFSGPKVSGPLTIQPTGNGRINTSGGFPAASGGNINYFVDVVFSSDYFDTNTVVLDSPPVATVTRDVRLVSLTNVGQVPSSIVLSKKISGVNTAVAPATLLHSGEMFEYLDGVGWSLYSSDGTIKANFAMNGATDKGLAYNNARSLDASSAVSWLKDRDALSVTGVNPSLALTAHSSATPTAPPSGYIQVTSQTIAGKIHLLKQGASADFEAVQASVWQNYVVLWTPSTGWYGTVGGTVGTAATVLPTAVSGTAYTAMRRTTYANTAGANVQAGIRSEAMFFRSTAPDRGGFFFVARFGFGSIKAGDRAFIGMTPGTNITTSEPSSLVNSCGFGFDSTDSSWYFMHRNATATTATKDSIPGQGTLATNDTGYDAYIWCAPNSSKVHYRLDRTDTGAVLIEGYTDTNLPVTNTLLLATVMVGSGTNTLANDAIIGINRLYVETNR